jgi:hypothetical protein
MVMAWIRSSLGPFVVIMDFFAAHPEILTGILTFWMVFYAAGHYQMKAIERRTIRFVLERSRILVAANPQITLADLRARIIPPWLEEMKEWHFWFIPHKFDFYPVRVTPTTVQAKLPLSPEWLATVLMTNGIALVGEPVQTPIKPLKK